MDTKHRDPKEFFNSTPKTRPYMIVSFYDYSTSEALYLTNKEYKILEDYCVDNNVQIYPYEDKTMSRGCIEEIWKEALKFQEDLDESNS